MSPRDDMLAFYLERKDLRLINLQPETRIS